VNVNLIRIESTEEHTAGVLIIDNNIICSTLELPYRNNEQGISCIPYGNYVCELKNSYKFGLVYQIMNVPNRSDILFHVGNSVNDISGCVLLGRYLGFLKNKRYLFESKLAFNYFMSFVKDHLFFNLNIQYIKHLHN
jgi:hypothetical protein